MAWMYKLVGLFADPRKRLDRVPLKAGMTVVDYACGPGRYTLEVAKRVEPGWPDGPAQRNPSHPQAGRGLLPGTRSHEALQRQGHRRSLRPVPPHLVPGPRHAIRSRNGVLTSAAFRLLRYPRMQQTASCQPPAVSGCLTFPFAPNKPAGDGEGAVRAASGSAAGSVRGAPVGCKAPAVSVWRRAR
jgi:hypothetical protein